MHKSIKMFMFCGISTIVWGVLFGGYFETWWTWCPVRSLGRRLPSSHCGFAPLNDPMRLLIYSMTFGLIHLFVGLGIKGYMLVKDGKIFRLFCDVALVRILIGLILMLLPYGYICINRTDNDRVPAGCQHASAKGLAIIGALGLLRCPEGQQEPALRIALGAYDIYNITGWLSDVLSYSRLLALGLATGVIASVVNQMGSMFKRRCGSNPICCRLYSWTHAESGNQSVGAYVHT